MNTLNYTFSNIPELKDFIKKKNLRNTNCFVQIFSGIIKKSLIKEILVNINSEINNPIINGVTTAGEFFNNKIQDNSIIISFSIFEKTKIISKYQEFKEQEHFEQLIDSIVKPDTKLVLIFANGFHQSAKIEYFIKIFYQKYPNIIVGGGKAGDNLLFKKSYVFNNKKISETGFIITSFSGKDLIVNNGYNFDWNPIGKEFLITKAKDNIIYEIDHTPITDFYKKYFGEEIANELPGIGLEFPLIINRDGFNIARGALQKAKNGGLVLTGNIYNGERVRLSFGHKGNILKASEDNFEKFSKFPIESVFVYSCAARKMFLGNDIKNEVHNINKFSPVSGFCSYSEFFHTGENIELLSYTTTYICLSEKKSTKRFKKIIPQKHEVEDKIMHALSHFISATNDELTEMNFSLESKVSKKINEINDQKSVYLESYQRIVDNMTDSILIVDETNNIIYSNKKLFESTGYNTQDLKYLGLENLFSKNCFKNYKNKSKKLKDFKGEIISKKGKKISVKVNILNYLDNGRVIILEDLGEVKQLKNLNTELLNKSIILHEYKNALDFTSFVIRIDKDKNIKYLNYKMKIFLGEDETKNIIGKNYLNYLGKNQKIFSNKSLKEELKYEDIFNHIDTYHAPHKSIREQKDFNGNIHWFLNYLIPIINIKGDIEEYISTSTDITQFITYEKNLKESNKKLNELNKRKTDFLNIASHELRNPLTSINGYISMIKDNDFGQTTPQLSNVLDIISNSLGQMIELISDMLDVSRIESSENNQCQKEKFDIKQELYNTYEEFLGGAKAKNITLNFTDKTNLNELVIDTCPKSIKKIFTNIISNAIKYTKDSGQVDIIIKDFKNYLTVEVKDNGIGIAKKDFGKIFEKFGQVGDSLNKDSKSSGLGLYIVKELIQQLGGEIQVESEFGVGSTFRVKICK